MVVAGGQGIPLKSRLFSTSPAEVILAKETLSAVQVPGPGAGRPRNRPSRLVRDRAYDSQRFRPRLAARGIELVCPQRRGRLRSALQDGRPPRRYHKRWKIESTFAHLGNFRRLLIRQNATSLLSRLLPFRLPRSNPQAVLNRF